MTDTTPGLIRRHNAEMELVKARHAVEVARLREALENAVPCLEDWISTTGFGTVNKRDRDALALIRAAITLPAPDVSRIEKDHRAMEVLRKGDADIEVHNDGKRWRVADYTVPIGEDDSRSEWHSDPADAILALEGKQ